MGLLLRFTTAPFSKVPWFFHSLRWFRRMIAKNGETFTRLFTRYNARMRIKIGIYALALWMVYAVGWAMPMIGWVMNEEFRPLSPARRILWTVLVPIGSSPRPLSFGTMQLANGMTYALVALPLVWL